MIVEDDVRVRAERCDKGEVRITPRDEHVLNWIGEMYACSLEHLQVLFARIAGDEDLNPVSEGVVRNAIRRWRRAGWVEFKKPLSDSKGIVYLTHRGLSYFGFDYKYSPPSLALINHVNEVNRARLDIELSDKFVSWISERSLRKEEGEKDVRVKKHIPDGIVYTTDEIYVAVEVEISRKTRLRLEKIIKALWGSRGSADEPGRYSRVMYYVTEDTSDFIENALDEFVLTQAHKLNQTEQEIREYFILRMIQDD
ncbi:MAG: hypothetical protein R3A44_25815 [Caldilineaceae bacterium]